MPIRALYVCYFGLREPLVQTQVLPYLRELAAGGVEMSLLTFEREGERHPERMRGTLAGGGLDDRASAHPGPSHPLGMTGIEWHSLPYHKRTWLKPFDILRGAWFARRGKFDLIHGRSHVGTAIGALATLFSRRKLIFDIRGFLAEEYVDSGNWRANGFLFRVTKAAERWLYRAADGFVVLTEKARESIRSCGKPLEVIPTCIDPARFAGDDRVDLRTDRPVFVYAGALGGYYLIDEMVALIVEAGAFGLVLTQGSTDAITEAFIRAGYEHYRVLQVAPDDVPRYLRSADVALLLVRKSYARRAMSPTKFAEYLAAGLPVIASAGIGDLDEVIPETRVGVVVQGGGVAAALRGMAELRRDPELGARCREVARTRYDLHTVGGVRYRRLYDLVMKR